MALASLRKRTLSFEPLERRDAPSVTPLLAAQNVETLHDDTAASVSTLLTPPRAIAQAEGEASQEEPFSLAALQQEDFDRRAQETRPLIPGLQASRNQTAATVQSLQQTISGARLTIAQDTTKLTNARNAESLLAHMPTYSISAVPKTRFITLSYENLPPGLDAVIATSAGVWARTPLTPGKASIPLAIPQGGFLPRVVAYIARSGQDLYIDLPNNDGVSVDKSGIRNAWGFQNQPMPTLLQGVVAPNPVDMANWQKELTDAQSRLASAETALPAAQTSASTAAASLKDALRTVIGNGRFEIYPIREPTKTTLNIRFRTTSDESSISMITTWENSSHIDRLTKFHKDGQADGWYTFTVETRNDANARIQFDCYEGDTLSDRIFATISGKSVTIDTPERPWESNETGKLSANPLPFDLTVARIEGPNILFHVSSPGDGSIIKAGEGGMFSEARLTHVGGTSSATALLTFGADKPSGTYALTLQDSKNLMERDRVLVIWNAVTRSLTLANKNDQWTIPATALPSIANHPELPLPERIATLLSDEAKSLRSEEQLKLQMSQQQRLTTISIANTGSDLARLQAATLYANSRFFVTMDQIYASFRKMYPDWDETHLDATVVRMWEEGKRSSSQSSIRNFLLSTIRDQEDRVYQGAGIYERCMQEIMTKAVEVVVGVHQGLPEKPLIAALANRIEVNSHYIGTMMNLGFFLPSVDAALEEGKRLYQTQLNALLNFQDEDAHLTRLMHEESEDPSWRKTHGGLSNIGILTEPLPAVITPTENENRSLARATRLAIAALSANTDPRARMSVAVREDANIQRLRQLADGSTEMGLTKAEALAINSNALDAAQNSGDDARVAGTILRRDLVASGSMMSLDVLIQGVATPETNTIFKNKLDFDMQKALKFLQSFPNPLAANSSIVASNFTATEATLFSKIIDAVKDYLIRNGRIAIDNAPSWWKWTATDYAIFVYNTVFWNPDVRAKLAIPLPGKPLPQLPENPTEAQRVEWQKALKADSIFRWTPPVIPSSGAPIAILMLGNLQTVDDTPGKGEAGLTAIEQKLQGNNYEVLKFRVGDWLNRVALQPGDVQRAVEQILSDRINRRGIFSGAPEVTGAAFAGYSWGGGAMVRTLNKWDAICAGKNVPVLASVAIDAITLDGLSSVNDRPANSEQNLTIFQEHDDGIIRALLFAHLATFESQMLSPKAIQDFEEAKKSLIQRVVHGTVPTTIIDGDKVIDLHLSEDHTSIDDNTAIQDSVTTFLGDHLRMNLETQKSMCLTK